MHFLLLSSNVKISTNDCPQLTRNFDPQFQLDPPLTVSGYEEKYLTLQCCFDGFVTIQWSFRRLNEKNWKDRKTESDQDQTFSLKRPYRDLNTGYYRCLATGNRGKNLSHSTFVYFFLANENENLTLIPQTSVPKSNYEIGENLSLSCEAKSFKPTKAITVRWLHKKTNDFTNINSPHISTNIKSGFNGTEEANPDLIEIFSNFSILNLQMNDNGTYKCVIEQDSTIVENIFLVLVNDDRIKWTFLFSSVAIVILITSSLSLGWCYRFRILVIYKTYFDMFPKISEYQKEYDLSLIYHDDDEISAKAAFSIAEILENRKFKCWLYDRNKQYGEEIYVNYSKVSSQSHTVLIFISHQSINNQKSLLKNFSSVQQNTSVRRLYVLNPSKKTIFKTLRENNPSIENWLKQELNLQSFCHRRAFNWNSKENIKFNTLITWIISSLPSLVIREARNKFNENISV